MVSVSPFKRRYIETCPFLYFHPCYCLLLGTKGKKRKKKERKGKERKGREKERRRVPLICNLFLVVTWPLCRVFDCASRSK